MVDEGMALDGLQGVVLDELVIFEADSSGFLRLRPHAQRLLARLQFSSLALESILHGIVAKETFQYVQLLEHFSITKALGMAGWTIPAQSSVYVSSGQNESLEELLSQGWKNIRVGERAVDSLLSGELQGCVVNVEQAFEIPAALARLNKTICDGSLLVIAYTMKWSRELEFLKLDQLLEAQLQVVDVVLHKATDEIVNIHSVKFGTLESVEFSKGIQNLQNYLQGHTHIRVVDPLERLLPLLDRAATKTVLDDLKVVNQHVVRPPRSVQVETFEEPSLSQALEYENVMLPTIVKPRIACGASESHFMAIVLEKEGFRELPVPLPALVQEYVDHGGSQYKMYLVGNKLFYSVRKSIPNASKLLPKNGSFRILFDSLKSLPVDLASPKMEDAHTLDSEAVRRTAEWLRNKLKLTILGFDIVVQSGSEDYIIVDVNYFPSFKDVPDEVAVPAFWEAIAKENPTFREEDVVFGR